MSDTTPIRAGEELNQEALNAYLREHLPELLGEEGSAIQFDALRRPQSAIEQFPGGHSNLTYLVRLEGREFVLRRPPVGPVAPTAHDMPREYRLLAAIHPVFPLAPRPYLLCEDTGVIGAPFYLMERRQGIVVRREIPPEIGNDLKLRRRVSESVVDTLADLHAIDIQANALDRLGKPAGFVERQVKGWAGRWERAKTSDVPAIDEVIAWLIKNLPPDPPQPTLLHNDYKLDNVMLDAADPTRVVAVLDWEMSAVGDPLVDLGILLCYWSQSDDPAVRLEAARSVTASPGWMTRAEIVERYAARTGRDVSAISYYETFALFKVAVVAQQIFFRYHNGQTQDARFASFDKVVAALAEAAWNLTRGSDVGYLCLNYQGRPRDLV
ncbi:MAG TPA: phosphotransferase family protein [Blastocatellia bacterium]|nr:phosphotransferase family protein [Blastocatellia bacterium]